MQYSGQRLPLVLVASVFTLAFTDSMSAQLVSGPVSGVGATSQFQERQGVTISSGANGSQFRLGLFGTQSSSLSMGGIGAGTTSLNGYPSFFFSGVNRPFVTGFTPVVQSGESPVRRTVREYGVRYFEARTSSKRDEVLDDQSSSHQSEQSTAESGDQSLASIKRQLAATDAANNAKAKQLVREARQAYEKNKYTRSIVLLSRAKSLATGELRDRIHRVMKKVRDHSREKRETSHRSFD